MKGIRADRNASPATGAGLWYCRVAGLPPPAGRWLVHVRTCCHVQTAPLRSAPRGAAWWRCQESRARLARRLSSCRAATSVCVRVCVSVYVGGVGRVRGWELGPRVVVYGWRGEPVTLPAKACPGDAWTHSGHPRHTLPPPAPVIPRHSPDPDQEACSRHQNPKRPAWVHCPALAPPRASAPGSPVRCPKAPLRNQRRRCDGVCRGERGLGRGLMKKHAGQRSRRGVGRQETHQDGMLETPSRPAHGGDSDPRPWQLGGPQSTGSHTPAPRPCSRMHGRARDSVPTAHQPSAPSVSRGPACRWLSASVPRPSVQGPNMPVRPAAVVSCTA